MSEIAPSPGGRRLLRGLLQNPVTVKELRSRMRGRRAFIILTLHVFLMSGFVTFLYLLYSSVSVQPFGPDPRQAGKTIFGAVVGIQALLVVFIGPSFTAASISGEKERQTYNLLRTTLLPARDLVAGKLLSALSYVLLLILSSVPIQSIAFLLGGVSLLELILSELLLLVAAVGFAMIGLFFSSLLRSTLAASMATFTTALALTVGLPALALVALPLVGALAAGPAISPVVEIVLIYAGMALATTNLPATLLISEIFLVQQDAVFFFTETVSGHTVYLFSPWFIFLILYSLLSIFLFWLTVRRVRRIPAK